MISSLHVHLFDIKTDQHILGNKTDLSHRCMRTSSPLYVVSPGPQLVLTSAVNEPC